VGQIKIFISLHTVFLSELILMSISFKIQLLRPSLASRHLRLVSHYYL
jgi:hypothetical protein